MELTFFIKGLILGFSVAAPVGPIGILCIRNIQNCRDKEIVNQVK